MADPPKRTAFLPTRGFTFVDSPPCTEALALDLLVAMGLGNVVAAYRAKKDAGRDPRLAVDVTLTADAAPLGSE